jgi:4-hydroxy-tetrahydrodipicolinate reductase
MSEKIKIAVNGAGGRMGQRIVALAHADPGLEVACAVEDKKSPALGRDAGELAGVGTIGVRIQRQLDGPVDVVIDFSVPEGLLAVTQICTERQIPLVAATTGLSEAQKSEILAAAHDIPLILAPNMSLAVNLTMKLVREAARALAKYPAGVDAESSRKKWGRPSTSTAATDDRANDRKQRSATTRSAWGTTSASTRSCSA